MGNYKINAFYNVDTENWQITTPSDEITDHTCNINIGFLGGNIEDQLNIEGIEFGFRIMDSNVGQNIMEVSFPRNVGFKYLYTNRNIMETIDINLYYLKTYNLHLWVTFNDKTVTEEYSFTMPRISSPYPSWVWNSINERWDPPVPHPDSDYPHMWDEETQTWIIPQEGPLAGSRILDSQTNEYLNLPDYELS